MSATTERRGRAAGVVGLAMAVVSIVGIVVALVVGGSLLEPAPQALPQTADGRPVVPEPQPGEDPVAVAAAATETSDAPPAPPVPGQPLRLRIPSVGIDAVVGSMVVPADRTVDPPTVGSAYWLRDYSVAGTGSTGTAYLAGHTFRGSGRGVFNPLFDATTLEARVHVGDAVELTVPEGTVAYVVTEVARYDKQTVPDQARLWENVPGRLVLVACWYNGADKATANMVIYAQLAEP